MGKVSPICLPATWTTQVGMQTAHLACNINCWGSSFGNNNLRRGAAATKLHSNLSVGNTEFWSWRGNALKLTSEYRQVWEYPIEFRVEGVEGYIGHRPLAVVFYSFISQLLSFVCRMPPSLQPAETMNSKHTNRQCGLAQLSLEHKRELDSLLAAQPAPTRAGYELLPAIQKQRYCNLEDVEKLMTIMDDARTNIFPCGLQNLRKSGQPYEIVLRLIANIEEAPAPPDGTDSAYVDLTDSRCYRQSLFKLLQVLRESDGSGDYGNAKLFVPFLQLLATDLLNIKTREDIGENDLQQCGKACDL